jgi:hypothetical protein
VRGLAIVVAVVPPTTVWLKANSKKHRSCSNK